MAYGLKSTEKADSRNGLWQNRIVCFSKWMCLVSAMIGASFVCGADWPTYQHDISRSGVTTEQLKPPLTPHWVFKPRHAPEPAWGDPKPKPVEGILELRRVHFDDVYQVAVSGDALFFGTSADNKVYCLDARTGQIRWTRLLNGPIRLAPTVWRDRVLVGSDDGYVYCFNAHDGDLHWKLRAAPSDQRVLGNGKLISLWPVRTGVLVDAGIAYFAAGVFPSEGVFLWAVRVDDGTVLWCNGAAGEAPQSRVAPQGYLLASATRIYAPMGRTSPATFDRKNGRLLNTAYFGKTIGGTYALLADESVFTGTEEMIAYRQDGSRARFAWFAGRKLIVTKDRCYMVTDRELSSLDRDAYGTAGLHRQSLLARKATLERSLKSAHDQLAGAKKELKAVIDEIHQAEAAMASSMVWRRRCANSDALILAGNVLFAGGQDNVTAVDANGGDLLWTGHVDGKAKGLAVAAGRLFVSTDSGAIHCFGSQEGPDQGIVTEPVTQTPFPQDELTPVYEAAADHILQTTGIKRGYCLVIGSETGRLAYELAKRTELTIYGIEPDAKKLAAARQRLDAAGLYGHRVTFEQWPLAHVPYADYFANLIVSESTLISGKLPDDAGEMLRMLKPLGGTIYLGQPTNATGQLPPLPPATLRQWLQESGFENGKVMTDHGTWIRVTRGALPGAGSWTHEYAEPGNTACGDDAIVKAPLGVLWFGRPGPNKIVNRHRRAAAPLSINGRLFVQGENVVMAYDAYNGLKLWERDITGAIRVNASHDGSNLAADANSLFVAIGDHCLRLDAATGRTVKTYQLPPAPNDRPRHWGYIAVVGQLLYGSCTERGLVSDCVFAVAIDSGKLVWTYRANRIPHNSIALGDGRLFLTASVVSDEERRAAVIDRAGNADIRKRRGEATAKDLSKTADVRRVVALDATTGKKLWTKAVDVTNCGSNNLAAMYHDDVLVLFGVYLDGHYWREFFAGQFNSRRIIALAGRDGHRLWSRAIGYRVRPMIIGQTLHAEPWAYDLHTGEQRQRIHPVTGRPEPWQFARPGHHCGCPAGTANLMLFRSYCIGYYDLLGDFGTQHFAAQRTGCWINFIPANGLVLVPEASAGCMCPFPNMCTVVLKPQTTNKAWAMFSSPGSMTPVRHLALNLGAPGDRKDAHGTLWLGYPRPRGSLVLQFSLDTRLRSGGNFFSQNPVVHPVKKTDTPWVFTSGAYGLSRCIVPVAGPADGAALYTVRLYFADLENNTSDQRTFDVALQGNRVLENFDIVREAGGAGRALVKEFKNVEAKEELTVELMSSIARPTHPQMPVLQGLEIVRERVLHLGLAVPAFLVNDAKREQTAVVQITNNKPNSFSGTLFVAAPQGLTMTPRRAKVELTGAGGHTSLSITAAVTGKLAPGNYTVTFKLVRPDGSVECIEKSTIEYLGDRGRVVVKAVEDAYVGASFANTNRGTATVLLVDGGDTEMGDRSHHVTYLKFPLDDIPGPPVSARLRLRNAGNPTGDSGRVCLVTDAWNEKKITYNNRPKPGLEVARIGRVSEQQIVDCVLEIPWKGQRELSLAIDPLSRDGVDYFSRESGKPAELIIEYTTKPKSPHPEGH